MPVNSLANWFVGFNYTAWQWQPTRTDHDPNPPVTLEDAAGAPPASTVPLRSLMGVGQ